MKVPSSLISLKESVSRGLTRSPLARDAIVALTFVFSSLVTSACIGQAINKKPHSALEQPEEITRLETPQKIEDACEAIAALNHKKINALVQCPAEAPNPANPSEKIGRIYSLSCKDFLETPWSENPLLKGPLSQKDGYCYISISTEK